jgi:hypothetical protein
LTLPNIRITAATAVSAGPFTPPESGRRWSRRILRVIGVATRKRLEYHFEV